jgi:hypothetical protein
MACNIPGPASCPGGHWPSITGRATIQFQLSTKAVRQFARDAKNAAANFEHLLREPILKKNWNTSKREPQPAKSNSIRQDCPDDPGPSVCVPRLYAFFARGNRSRMGGSRNAFKEILDIMPQ